jgi:hypothetical protein
MSARAAATLAFMWWSLARTVSDLVEHGIGAPLLLLGRDALAIVLSYAVARFAFSARSRLAMTTRVALGALVIVIADGVFFDRGGPVTFAIFAATIPGVFVPLYALLLSRVVGEHVAAASVESADRALVTGATWVLAGQVPLSLLLLAALGLEGDWPHGQVLPWERMIPFFVLYLAAPAAVVVNALLRIRARRLWLGRVRAGELRGWRIVERAGDTKKLPHLLRIGAAAGARMLVRVRDAAQPFRESERFEPVALVPAAWGNDLR